MCFSKVSSYLNLSDITLHLAVCLFAIIGVWIRSSMSLSKQFSEVTKEDIKSEMKKADDTDVKVTSKVGEGGFVEGEVVPKDKPLALSSTSEE